MTTDHEFHGGAEQQGEGTDPVPQAEPTPRDEALSALAVPDTETVPQLTERISQITDITILRGMGMKDSRRMAKAAIGARIGELTLMEQTSGALSPAELLMADLDSPVVNDKQDIFESPANKAAQASNEQGAVEGGTVEHRTMAKRAVYVIDRDGLWMRRIVPLGNVPLMLAEGARADCGHCGSPACRSELGARAYDCPAMTPRQFGRCPICRKAIDDPLNPDAGQVPEGGDPREVEIANFSELSPKQRITMRTKTHMTAYHAGEVAMLGVEPEKATP